MSSIAYPVVSSDAFCRYLLEQITSDFNLPSIHFINFNTKKHLKLADPQLYDVASLGEIWIDFSLSHHTLR